MPDTSEKVKEAVDKYRDETGVDVTMYCFGAAQGFRNMLALLEDFDPEQAPPPVTLDDKGLESKTALVFWTSGTTGIQIIFLIEGIKKWPKISPYVVTSQ